MPKNKAKKVPQKILIVKRDALGDIISVTPFLEVLKRAYPNANVTYVVGSWSSKVLENNPYVDNLVVVDSKKWQSKLGMFWQRAKLLKKLRSQGFDTVFILQGPAPFNFWGNFSKKLGCKNRVGYKKKGRETVYTHSVELPVYKDHLFKVLSKNRAEHYLDLLRSFGVKDTSNEGNSLFLKEKDRSFAENFFASNGLDSYSVIAISPGGAINPGTKQQSKRWPLERYAKLIKKLLNRGNRKILFIGGPTDETVVKDLINLLGNKYNDRLATSVGETSIHQSAALIEKSTIFIGNDSGPLHIASATKTPIIGIFGPTNPVVDGPYKAKGEMLFKKTEYSPCYSQDCKGHTPCIYKILVNQVLESAENYL